MKRNRANDRKVGQNLRVVARRVAALYKGCALMFFNIIVMYVVVNVGLGMAIGIRDLVLQQGHSGHDPVTARYGSAALDQVYPNVDRKEREVMLAEVWKPPFTYSDFNHFRTRPRAGKYVNVSEAGYRESANQGPWPPAEEHINIFVFGGSTTYGSGVPDDQTVPSFLQEAFTAHSKKRVCIYNFGVGFYYSTQERICLEKLLMDGYVPNIAIFIDGMNEGDHWENRPTYSHEMEVLFERFGASRSLTDEWSYWRSVVDVSFQELPIGRAARYARRRLVPGIDEPLATQNWDGGASVDRVCETYFTNKFLIEQLCGRFGVTPIFVWQPSPIYNYDLKYHLFAPPDSAPSQMTFKFENMRAYYPRMRDLHDQRGEANFIWCADIQKDRAECLYCDKCHYTGAFSKVLADYICQICIERALLDEHLTR